MFRLIEYRVYRLLLRTVLDFFFPCLLERKRGGKIRVGMDLWLYRFVIIEKQRRN